MEHAEWVLSWRNPSARPLASQCFCPDPNRGGMSHHNAGVGQTRTPHMDIQSVFSLLDKDILPTLKAVFQVALTIPVSSCCCDRSFSALRWLHTWLRNTMGQELLSHLAVMWIEKKLLDGLHHGEVTDRFAQLKSRCHTLMLPRSHKVY